MSDLRPTIFAPKTVSNTDQANLRTAADVRNLVGEARRAGGILASWRIQKQINAEVVQSVGEAVTAHFVARREELAFRIALVLDNAKKRAIADSLADTAVIEREIVRVTQEVIKELLDGSLEASKQAALDEVKRLRELTVHKDRGEITESRYGKEVRKIEHAADEIGDKAEAVANRVIENLGERLEAALRTYQAARP